MSSSSRWSPLTCLPAAELTPSGLLQLDSDDGEVDLAVIRNVEIRSANAEPMTRRDESVGGAAGPGSAGAGVGPWIDRDANLSLSLTTHRLVLSDRDESGSVRRGGPGVRFIHLSSVHTANADGGPTLFSPMASYKMLLSTHSYGELVLAFKGSKSSSSMHNGKSDREEALKQLGKALERRAWEEGARRAQKQKDSAARQIASRKVGVDAIMAKNKLKHAEAKKLTDEAFAGGGDVDVLMREAGELVAVIRRYAADLERSRADQESKTGEGAGDDTEDARRLAGMLEDMGMTGALTKEQATRGGGEGAYYQRLARQLSDFLRRGDRLQTAGGMMTLTDVYCLFNRARGTNMVSPEDLIKALHWTGELELGISKREFPSGVTVVQEDGFDDEAAARKLVELSDELTKKGGGVVNSGGVTVLDASRSLKISAMLANEQLLSAERMGYLCRDSTLEGMRFYRNMFTAGDFVKC